MCISSRSYEFGVVLLWALDDGELPKTVKRELPCLILALYRHGPRQLLHKRLRLQALVHPQMMMFAL